MLCSAMEGVVGCFDGGEEALERVGRLKGGYGRRLDMQIGSSVRPRKGRVRCAESE